MAARSKYLSTVLKNEGSDEIIDVRRLIPPEAADDFAMPFLRAPLFFDVGADEDTFGPLVDFLLAAIYYECSPE
ncbi:MAG: hypothetical protein KDD67_07200 [Ignavibacteriae bacterium]|nr:hypothetical protein [Ignavibacteriota bacterium]MCB9215263.1 hypothetical protein [Ignavibacteria bacterium]